MSKYVEDRFRRSVFVVCSFDRRFVVRGYTARAEAERQNDHYPAELIVEHRHYSLP